MVSNGNSTKKLNQDALKEALEKSYKKNYGGPESIIRVDINANTGKIRLYEIKHVVDDVNDEDYELSIEEAQMINPKYQVGDDVVTEVDPEVFGRLAAIQTKQLLKQKIREAEKEFYKHRTEGEPLKWLGSGYRRNEKTRFDDFVSPYMGKDYGGSSYELVSMGFEYAYTRPEELAKDPEMEAWILGILALY